MTSRELSMPPRNGGERYFCNCGYDGVIFANAAPIVLFRPKTLNTDDLPYLTLEDDLHRLIKKQTLTQKTTVKLLQ